MKELEYLLYVSAKGEGLPPMLFDKCSDQNDVLRMVEGAMAAGHYQFVVVLG